MEAQNQARMDVDLDSVDFQNEVPRASRFANQFSVAFALFWVVGVCQTILVKMAGLGSLGVARWDTSDGLSRPQKDPTQRPRLDGGKRSPTHQQTFTPPYHPPSRDVTITLLPCSGSGEWAGA